MIKSSKKDLISKIVDLEKQIKRLVSENNKLLESRSADRAVWEADRAAWEAERIARQKNKEWYENLNAVQCKVIADQDKKILAIEEKELNTKPWYKRLF
jgi:hypothetical protein